ncbi:MAG: PIN domain-containing protein [Chitinophagaceae bacterium]
MATKIFLNTNIVLDVLDDKRPFHASAVEIWRKIETNHLDAYISESVVTATDYILQKTTRKPLRINLLTELLYFLQILPCTTLICINAFQNTFSDLEDTILYQIALVGDVDYFITNDSKAQKKLSSGTLPVISTKEFLNING